LEINKKNLSSNFHATSREKHQFIFRNKTEPPDVGKYNPRMHSVDAKAKIAKIEDQQENAISARKKMFDLSFNK
jgi:hypothetical protein